VDSKGKHSPPTFDTKRSASIKRVITTAAESRRNCPAPIEESGVKETAGKHYRHSGISFWECVFDFVTFIIALLFYGLIAYVFYKLNLHSILFQRKL
jgi:hypothetical protein